MVNTLGSTDLIEFFAKYLTLKCTDEYNSFNKAELLKINKSKGKSKIKQNYIPIYIECSTLIIVV